MIYETLDKRIADAMIEEKERQRKYKTNFWKYVKTEMTLAMHEGAKIPDVETETKILQKMLKRSKNAIQEFSNAGENKVAKENLEIHEFEAAELEKLLPKEPSVEEVTTETVKYIGEFVTKKNAEDQNFNISQLQRYTKDIINLVKNKLPTAQNSVIANIVKETTNKKLC